MKLFGMLIPVFRKGASVIVIDASCARGTMAETIFQHLDPDQQYKRSLYGTPKRGSKGSIVALMKYKEASGESHIYCGVLIKDQLHAMEESRLTRA